MLTAVLYGNEADGGFYLVENYESNQLPSKHACIAIFSRNGFSCTKFALDFLLNAHSGVH